MKAMIGARGGLNSTGLIDHGSMTGVSNNLNRKKCVLDEDSFVGLLENVIEEQFFPHLSKMKKQLEFLKQHETFSLHTLRSSYNKLVAAEENEKLEDQDMQSITIPEFFARFTSEDNQSFEKIFAKDQEDKRRKYHWLHESLNRIAISDGKELTTDKKAGMLMLYHIGNKVLSAEERDRMDSILAGEKMVGDDRPAQVDSWAFRVRNQLMFYPELRDSLQISGVRQSAPRNVAHNQLLLTASLQDHDSRIRSALPTKSSSNSLLLTSSQDQFAIPSAPSRKSINQNSASSFRNEELILQKESNGLYGSYANNNPKRAEKIIVPGNANTPGSAFAESIDSYLRGKVYRPSASEAAIVEKVLPAPMLPLEAAHTPTTINTNSPGIGSDNIHSNLPLPPPQMPLKKPLTHKKSEFNPDLGDDWEVASTSAVFASNNDVANNRSYVEMTPLLIPGEGLVRSPIVTWGQLCGPIVVLSGPYLQQKQHPIIEEEIVSKGDEGKKSTHKKKEKKESKKSRPRSRVDSHTARKINPSATSLENFPSDIFKEGSFGANYGTLDAPVAFHFQAPRVREVLALKMDANAQAAKRTKVSHSSIERKSTHASTASSQMTTPLRRLTDMSPAAQSLAKKVLFSQKNKK